MDIEKRNKNDACVIGNGTSRLQLDLDSIHALYVTYGCNALYRDFVTDYLISMDMGMVDEILRHQAYNKSILYTQHDNRIENIKNKQKLPINFVRSQRETVDSGNSAIDLAATHKHDKIYMVGFDYTATKEGLFNNVYAGTKEYAAKNSTHIHPNQTHRWLQRISATVKRYPTQQFIRINGNDYSLGIKQDNYSEITIEQFREIINK